MKTYIVPTVSLALCASLLLVIAVGFWSVVYADDTVAATATTAGDPVTISESDSVTIIDESSTNTPLGVSFLPTEEGLVTEESATDTVDEEVPEVTPAVTTATVSGPAATLSTDKDDYHPGTTATIFGSFFTPLQNFVLKIFGSDENDQNYTEQTATVVTDEDGAFSFKYLLDALYRPFYNMVVSTPEGDEVASSYFRDSSIGTYDQCSNDLGVGYTTGDLGCRWTNGNIQVNNSKYFEGDSTVQRLWIEGYAPGSSHTVTFKYGTTKAGKHAYDYLTTWDASENWVTLADRCQDITGCATAAESQTVMQNDPNTTDTIEPAAAGRKFTIRGGTIASSTVPTIVSGTYAGDSETSVTVNFTVASAGDMCSTKSGITSCGIAIWFGAHVAKGSEWTTFNNTTGAGSINGAPYHVALDKEDGASVGQRDNQMQSAAVLPPAATGIITIIKDTVPNDPQNFAFTTSGTGLNNFSLDDDSDPALSNTQTFTALADGTYSVTETPFAGFDLTNIVCQDLSGGTTVNVGTGNASINLTGGETVTCTYTNAKRGSLTIVKNTIGGNDTFNFTGNTGVTTLTTVAGTAQQVVSNILPGTYNITETAKTGWTQTSATCSDGSPVSAIDIAAGENVTCTFTNTKNATLRLVKTVVNDNGGTAVANDFQGKIDGSNVAWGATTTLTTGAHTASETTLPNYTAGSWGGDCATDGSVTLAAGDNKTCTITNNDNAPALHLRKVVVNDNGGTKTAADFTLTANGAGVNDISGTSPVDSGAGLLADTFALSESAVSGYDASAWVCVGGTQNGSNITLGIGQSATCTITNNDIAPKLTVTKVVINHGGTKVVSDFPLFVDATGVTSGVQNTVAAGSHVVSETGDVAYTATISGDCNPTTGAVTLALADVKACTITNEEKLSDITVHKVVINHGGTKVAADFAPYKVDATTVALDTATTFDSGNHTVTEVPDANYIATFSGDCDAQGVVALGANEHKSCTITNEEKPARLVVTKVVINDNGGTKVVADFPLFVGTTSVTSGATTTFDSASYIVSETGDAGYNATISGDCNPSTGAVTLVPGVTKQCTITNNDKPAHLIVVKHVDNGTTGATAVAGDFTTTIAGVTTVTPVAAGSEAPGIDNTLTTVGAYTVTEGAHVDYTMSASADCAATIALGETKTCTITNTAIAPKLTVIKVVDNGNTGATTVPADFQMMVDAGNVPQNIAQTETVGTHTVTESGPAGYTSAFSGDCNASGTVSLALSDDKTCTITNTAIAPKLTLVKVVVNNNGGTKVVSDFPLSIDATGVTSGVKNTTTVGAHTASEIPDAGYTASDWTGDCAANGTISLALADDKTCTITNDDKPGHLIVRKVTNPTDTTTEFSITATGGTIVTPAATQPIVGGGSVDYTVHKGTYSASEAILAGWDETANTCTGVVINNGETKECTITNTKKGHLIVDKVTLPAGATTSFTILAAGNGTITGGGAGSVTDAANKEYEVTPGTYGVTETVPAGWDQTSNTCTDVAIAAGETKTCTITNTKRATVTIVKDATPQDTQDFAFSGTLGAFTLDDDAGVVDPIAGEELGEFSNTKTFVNQVPGAVSVTEAQANQYWILKSASCVLTGTATVVTSSLVGTALSFTTTPGADVTCTFVNEKQSPTRTQGFWQTHTAFTSSVFAALANPMKIGANATKITTASQLFGAWYSSIPKTTTGQQRTAVDKARMTLLQQLVTAKLNCAKFGCAASVQTMIATADTAYASGTPAQILSSSALLDAYNNSGDTIVVGNTGKATPKVSESTANKVFWNVLP